VKYTTIRADVYMNKLANRN